MVYDFWLFDDQERTSKIGLINILRILSQITFDTNAQEIFSARIKISQTF